MSYPQMFCLVCGATWGSGGEAAVPSLCATHANTDEGKRALDSIRKLAALCDVRDPYL
jgi:hypothetical protein